MCPSFPPFVLDFWGIGQVVYPRAIGGLVTSMGVMIMGVVERLAMSWALEEKKGEERAKLKPFTSHHPVGSALLFGGILGLLGALGVFLIFSVLWVVTDLVTSPWPF